VPRARGVGVAPEPLRIGTAGWTLPRAIQDHFAGEGSHLARYARVFDAAEINSSFHRPHRRSTYERWAASVPARFRFCVKVPKTITHAQKLIDAAPLLDRFLDEARGLGERLGCLLVQLPPSLAMDAQTACRFFAELRERYDGDVVIEPRHASWFTSQADELLVSLAIARVAADPARVPAAAHPGGRARLAYWRWHGAPRVYWSSYDDAALRALADSLIAAIERGAQAWCIFDNTASGAAAGNALALQALVRSRT
jgi:uncharacterized protein YecE (DUF72 family)